MEDPFKNHKVLSTKYGVPKGVYPPQEGRGGPKNAKTNPIYRTPSVPPPPISAKQTQSPYGHGTPCPHCAKRNQFPQGQPPKNTKRTQFPPGPRPNPPITRNEPNLRTGTACRAPIMQNKPNSRPAGVSLAFPPPRSAKQTQSTNYELRTRKCETNPIPADPHIIPVRGPNPRTTNHQLRTLLPK